MREKILDPHNQPNNAAERRLGVTPQREQNRAQERAARYQENKGIAIVDDEGRLIGQLIRELAVIGSGATVTVQGNRVTIDVSGGSGGTIIVQNDDVDVDTATGTVDFSDQFSVTSSPAGEANVSIADNYVLNTGDTITGDLLLQSTSTTQLQAKNAGGTEYFRVDTSNAYLGAFNAADFLVYSDAGITVKYSVDGATGVVTFGLPGGATVPSIRTGTGSPEGVVSAQVSSLFLRSDGGTDTAVYRKESGTGNTGWVAVAAGSGSGLTHPQVMSRAWLVS